jgi:hypothetical protein
LFRFALDDSPLETLMHNLLRALIVGVLAPTLALAQNATVIGQVRVADGGHPLGYSAVSVVAPPMNLLTGDAGRFTLVNLPAGQLRIRIKHIGYAPRDTVLMLAANDTARIEVSLSRLVIQLPAMLVSGKCTNQSPTEAQPAVLAELFDQVNQNAERYRMLANAKPFVMQVYRVLGIRNPSGTIVPTSIDTIVRRPFPPSPYKPKEVVTRGEGAQAGDWVLGLPELPDFADTAFTNNHCFRYAGKTKVDEDSLIQVDYEPVPWLDKEVDIEGSLFVRTTDYQLVRTITKLNKVPGQLSRAGLLDATVVARFSEVVSGVPVLDQWELLSRYRRPIASRISLGQVFGIKWVDSAAVKPDTVRR